MLRKGLVLKGGEMASGKPEAAKRGEGNVVPWA